MNTPTALPKFTSAPTEEQIAMVSSYLEKGLHRCMAGYAAGVGQEQLQHWLDLNPRLEVAFGAAESRFQARCLEAILAPGDGKNKVNVRAIMWLLQHRFPDQFGKPKAAPRRVMEPQPAPASEIHEPAAVSTIAEITVPEIVAVTAAPQQQQSNPVPQTTPQPVAQPITAPACTTTTSGLRVLKKFAYTQGQRRS